MAARARRRRPARRAVCTSAIAALYFTCPCAALRTNEKTTYNLTPKSIFRQRNESGQMITVPLAEEISDAKEKVSVVFFVQHWLSTMVLTVPDNRPSLSSWNS